MPAYDALPFCDSKCKQMVVTKMIAFLAWFYNEKVKKMGFQELVDYEGKLMEIKFKSLFAE